MRGGEANSEFTFNQAAPTRANVALRLLLIALVCARVGAQLPDSSAETEAVEEVAEAEVKDRRVLTQKDLNMDFLSKMGFVPPPPPPPWGFNTPNGSLAEVEERVMRQLVQIAELPRTMLCDMCGAVAYQLTARMQVADTRITARNKKKRVGALQLVTIAEDVCSGLKLVPQDGHPATWDHYGVADRNESCSSPSEVNCWNSTKRLVGPGCDKEVGWEREKEKTFGWLATRITPECQRLVDEYGEDDIYAAVRKGSPVTELLCAADCEAAARAQAREAHAKYVEDYGRYTKDEQRKASSRFGAKLPGSDTEKSTATKPKNGKKKRKRKKGKKKKRKATQEL